MSPRNQEIADNAQLELGLIMEAFSGQENTPWTRQLVRRRCSEWADQKIKDGVICDYSIGCQDPRLDEVEYIRVNVLLQPSRSIEYIQISSLIGPQNDTSNSN